MRRIVSGPLIAAALCILVLLAAPGGASEGVRIELHSKKFEFSAAELRVRKGQPVILVLRTDDFAHGFSIPDFNARADYVPGKIVELRFTPDRAGRFVFLCDNFCGEEHDFMTGTLIVTES